MNSRAYVLACPHCNYVNTLALVYRTDERDQQQTHTCAQCLRDVDFTVDGFGNSARITIDFAVIDAAAYLRHRPSADPLISSPPPTQEQQQ